MAEYKLQSINIEADNVEDVVIPEVKDRIIEKTGHVTEFTLRAVEENMAIVDKNIKEIVAKRDHEDAKMQNIQHFHPFVLEMSDEDLLTAWLYQEARGIVQLCDTKLAEINEQREKDLAEIAEIKAQIPELND